MGKGLKRFVYCNAAIQVAVYKTIDERLVACSKTCGLGFHSLNVCVFHPDSDVVG